MKVILKQKVKGIGEPGQIKEVSDGYARNFLLPKGLAVLADANTIRSLEQQRNSAEKKDARELAQSQELQKKIEAITLEYTANAGEGGRLFGSVTSKDIGDEMARKGIKVDRRKIQLAEPIRQLGEYTVDIRLHPQVTATLKLVVKAG
jgi:large subunit ribosomal protein L9